MIDPRGRDPLTVLVVEDNADDQLLLVEATEARGHTVIACQTAEEGLAALDRDDPDLILLDLILPGMDGLDFARLVRERPDGEWPVVVVVTIRDEPAVLQEVLEVGADDYVSKPVDRPILDVRLAVAERAVMRQRARRRDRAALEAKSEELRAVFENLDQGFFSVDLRDGHLIQASPAVSRLLGASPERLTEGSADWRRTLSAALPPEGGLTEGGATGSLTRQFSVRQGDEGRWIEATLRTEEENGTPARLYGLLSDVTERRRAQEQLAIRNHELATLYRISELTLSSTTDRTYGDVIDEVRQATGFPVALVTRSDPARRTLRVVGGRGPGLPEALDIELPADRGPIAQALQRAVPVVLELRPDDDLGAPQLQALGLRTLLSFPLTAGRRVLGTLTLGDTEVRKPEDRLVRWAALIAGTVATVMERHSALEALRDSDRRHRALAGELRRANEELESFAYSVSHDLRAPLRTMQGFAHTLLNDLGAELPREATDHLQRILRSGRQAEALISDLLTYSRVSYEDLELGPVELDGVVERARERVQADLSERSARLEIDGPLPTVHGHHAMLVHVVANLLSNAAKFVDADRAPEIRVRARGSEGSVRLWVLDNGVGIPKDRRDKIFKVFERLMGDGPQPTGTGIGLAIVRRGMEKMGGRVGVEEAEGGGSAFWVDIPTEAHALDWQPWPSPTEGPEHPEGS